MKIISLLQIMDNCENVPAVTKEAFCLEREHILLREFSYCRLKICKKVVPIYNDHGY